ncbi:transposase [Streptomyces sp. NPDC058457]|uniref:transposase n=1 Tax=Streptomyces sp. NPDC058457 TaxID=3346507 RepID=UPI0036560222
MRHPSDRPARVRSLDLTSRKGEVWRPDGGPRRLRATCNRYGRVMHMLAALDLAIGKIYYRICKRKRWREFSGLLKALRPCWPREKLYLVPDDFSPHKHTDVRTWAADNDIELVFLLAYGPWLNWIELKFVTLRYLAPTIRWIASRDGGRATGSSGLVRLAYCIVRSGFVLGDAG